MSAFYDLASLVLVPSGYKASKVYAQKPLTTDGQLTFSRASTATRVNSAGLIETVSSNVPRLDYLNSSCPKLNLEPQRTNVLTYSEQLNNAAWGNAAAVTANSIVSPDGYTNADTVTGILSQLVSYTSGTTYTFSVFAKKNTGSTLTLRADATAAQTCAFNLDTLVTSAGGTISNYGNGWYRCAFTFTATATATGVAYILPPTSVYLYGCQHEVGAYATSYIPTLGAAVTRGADACSKTGISSLIGQTEGTLFVEVPDWQLAFDTLLFSVSDGSLNNYIQISTNSITGNLQSVIFAGGGATALGSTTPTAGQTVKIAVGYKLNDYALYVNGVQIGTLTSKAAPSSLTRTDVGSLAWISSGLQPRPKFAQALLFKTRLTNAQLAELTTL